DQRRFRSKRFGLLRLLAQDASVQGSACHNSLLSSLGDKEIFRVFLKPVACESWCLCGLAPRRPARCCATEPSVSFPPFGSASNCRGRPRLRSPLAPLGLVASPRQEPAGEPGDGPEVSAVGHAHWATRSRNPMPR